MEHHTVDLAKLVAMMAQEVIAQTQSRARRTRCGCHAVFEDCCPTRMQPMVEAGATRFGLDASGGAPGTVAGLIDHTLLKPDATRAEVDEKCYHLVAPVIGKKRARTLCDTVWNIEALKDARRLTPLLTRHP